MTLASKLPLASLSLLLLLLAPLHSLRAESSPEVPPGAEVIKNPSQELSDEKLGSIVEDFGRLIKDVMHDEMDKLIEDVEASGRATAGEPLESTEEQRNGRINAKELEHLKDAHEALTRDTQKRIEMIGQKNEGQLTQSGSSADSSGLSFLTRVKQQLQSAGSFIDYQMSSLSNLAPKIKGKLQSIPGKLRKLLHWPSFSEFRLKFKRTYESPREELYRQMVYLHSQTIVGIKNLKYLVGRDKYLLKATQFADRTGVEYQQTYNNNIGAAEAGDSVELDAELRRKLESLAATGKNVYGGSGLPAGVIASEQHRRKKRSSVAIGHSELDDEEDEMEVDDEGIGNELAEDGDDEDTKMDEINDDAMMVDSYAADFDDDADTSKMDEIDALMDEALAEDPLFKRVDLRQMRPNNMPSCLIKPENQDSCGACYAYVTAAAASFFNCVANNEPKPARYNPRFISDCGRYFVPEGRRPTVNGCAGGIMSEAIKFTANAGTRLFMDYELARLSHDFKSDKCAYPRPEQLDKFAPIEVPYFKQTYFSVKKMSDVNLVLRTVGPVFINLRTWNNFPLQGNGIYDAREESVNPTIHSMLIVGYDKDPNGRGYWILWNSHGTAWGEHGFVRVYSESLEYFKTFMGALMTSEMIEQTRQQA